MIGHCVLIQTCRLTRGFTQRLLVYLLNIICVPFTKQKSNFSLCYNTASQPFRVEAKKMNGREVALPTLSETAESAQAKRLKLPFSIIILQRRIEIRSSEQLLTS